jgi:HSP20 family protein
MSGETEVKKSRGAGPVAGRTLPRPGEVSLPAVDISENAREIILEIEVPGVLEKDIEILLYPNRIEIKGSKREVPVHKRGRYHRLEREFGIFRREVFVPSAVDPDRAYARLANGVLTVVLEKSQARSEAPEIGGFRRSKRETRR